MPTDLGEWKVQVTGLREFERALKELDDGLVPELKLHFLDIATRIAGLIRVKASADFAHATGKAAGSIKAHGTQKGASVTGGGARVPYYPWLDFGGGDPHARGVTPQGASHAEKRQRALLGRNDRRPWIPGGRYMFPVIKANLAETEEEAKSAISVVARKAGFGVEEH